jgi:hypothetical protein
MDPIDDASPLFRDPHRREEITLEPERSATALDPRYPDVDWIGYEAEGEGHVPDDYFWTSNPKQEQDDLMGE